MKRKLFVAILVLNILTTAVTALFFGGLTQDTYRQEKMASMQQIGRLIQEDIRDGEAVTASTAQEYAGLLTVNPEQTGLRVTIIDKNGQVLSDSSASADALDNHGERPEVEQAIQEGAGWQQRYSQTLGHNMLYVACYDQATGVVVRVALPMQTVENVYAMIGWYAVVGIVVSALIALLVSYWLSKWLAKPIDVVKDAVRGLQDNDYMPISPLPREEEFRELALCYNDMAKQMRDWSQDIQVKNEELSAVVESMQDGLLVVDGDQKLLRINAKASTLLGTGEQKNARGLPLSTMVYHKPLIDLVQEQLRTAKNLEAEFSIIGEGSARRIHATALPMHPYSGCLVLLTDVTQLRQLENMRQEFVSNVTHELRTPLTSIRGYVETLLGGAASKPDVCQRFLEIIEIEADRLSNLIGDLLDLSNIENHPVAGAEPVDLCERIGHVQAVLEPQAKAHGVSLHSHMPSHLYLMAHKERIEQLLLNLIDNAIKYNRPNGVVDIHCETQGEWVILQVKDTGIGIMDADQERIFERFYRVDKGRSREMGGTGLGLSIVKHIAGLYGGSVQVSSVLGEGATFEVRLPRGEVPPLPLPKADMSDND